MDGERCRSQPRKTSESPSRNVKRVTRLHLHLRKKKKPKHYAGMTGGKEQEILPQETIRKQKPEIHCSGKTSGEGAADCSGYTRK